MPCIELSLTLHMDSYCLLAMPASTQILELACKNSPLPAATHLLGDNYDFKTSNKHDCTWMLNVWRDQSLNNV